MLFFAYVVCHGIRLIVNTLFIFWPANIKNSIVKKNSYLLSLFQHTTWSSWYIKYSRTHLLLPGWLITFIVQFRTIRVPIFTSLMLCVGEVFPSWRNDDVHASEWPLQRPSALSCPLGRLRVRHSYQQVSGGSQWVTALRFMGRRTGVWYVVLLIRLTFTLNESISKEEYYYEWRFIALISLYQYLWIRSPYTINIRRLHSS